MGPDRQIIADQILKAIDYGNLPRDEIERRLNQIIDTELDVPSNTEINQEKVDLCSSLLHQLYTHGVIDHDETMEKSKEAVIKRFAKHKKRVSIAKYAIRSIAAALILVIGLSLFNIIPPIRWFTGTSTDDEQQYIVQGHVISTQTIANAIAEHEGNDSYVADSEELVNEYLGFDIGLSETLIQDYKAQMYYVSIVPEYINIICDYVKGTDGKESRIRIIKTVFIDTDYALFTYEQDATGDMIRICNYDVYRFINTEYVNYLWLDNNIMYNVNSNDQFSSLTSIIEDIMLGRNYK